MPPRAAAANHLHVSPVLSDLSDAVFQDNAVTPSFRD